MFKAREHQIVCFHLVDDGLVSKKIVVLCPRVTVHPLGLWQGARIVIHRRRKAKKDKRHSHKNDVAHLVQQRAHLSGIKTLLRLAKRTETSIGSTLHLAPALKLGCQCSWPSCCSEVTFLQATKVQNEQGKHSPQGKGRQDTGSQSNSEEASIRTWK